MLRRSSKPHVTARPRPSPAECLAGSPQIIPDPSATPSAPPRFGLGKSLGSGIQAEVPGREGFKEVTQQTDLLDNGLLVPVLSPEDHQSMIIYACAAHGTKRFPNDCPDHRLTARRCLRFARADLVEALRRGQLQPVRRLRHPAAFASCTLRTGAAHAAIQSFSPQPDRSRLRSQAACDSGHRFA